MKKKIRKKCTILRLVGSSNPIRSAKRIMSPAKHPAIIKWERIQVMNDYKNI